MRSLAIYSGANGPIFDNPIIVSESNRNAKLGLKYLTSCVILKRHKIKVLIAFMNFFFKAYPIPSMAILVVSCIASHDDW